MLLGPTSSRRCARCRKDLTDAASIEAGIGPICRQLDNALLALCISANVVEARSYAARVYTDALPEPARNTFHNVMADLQSDLQDWRKTVKRVEWLMSWNTVYAVQNALIGIVRSLGYVGLASLLAGEASTGEATVMFQAGRLHLQGSRCKHGARLMKKIQGWKLRPATSELKATWSVPASAWEKFHLVVITYWPNVSGLDEALELAKSSPVTPVPTEASAPKYSISDPAEGKVKLSTPYHGGFVQELKSLPRRDRVWIPESKIWEVSVAHLPFLKDLVARYFR